MAETKAKTEMGASPDTGEIKAVTFKGLVKAHGDQASKVYDQICKVGGFGSLGKDHIGGDGQPEYPPLDYSGAPDSVKTAINKLLQADK